MAVEGGAALVSAANAEQQIPASIRNETKNARQPTWRRWFVTHQKLEENQRSSNGMVKGVVGQLSQNEATGARLYEPQQPSRNGTLQLLHVRRLGHTAAGHRPALHKLAHYRLRG